MRISIGFKSEEAAKKTLQGIIDQLDNGTGSMTFEIDGYSPDTGSNHVTVEFVNEGYDEFDPPMATINQGD
jgi:hypothetical protein